MSNGFRRQLLELDPQTRAVCESPLLPFIARACGACDDNGQGGGGDVGQLGEVRAHHPGHDLHHHHVHIDRGDLAVFEEDPDNRPYVWDLEESCSCH